jgi:hypothetical protein
MTITTGIALSPAHGGPLAPELEAVFMCESLDDVEFFVGFGQHPLVDVWEVDARGLRIEPAPDGWVMCREPLGPERVRLLHAGRTPERRELCTATLLFVSERLSVAAMSGAAGVAPDESGREDGEDLGRVPGTPYSWWLIEGGDRYAPLAGQVDEVVGRIAAAEAGFARLATDSDEATFVARGRDAERVLSQRARALLDRIGVSVECSE